MPTSLMHASENDNSTYAQFLLRKQQLPAGQGFEPIEIPEFLHDFQAYLTDWSIRRGRAAVLADCGMGKTPILLVWCDNVIRHTNKSALVLTPLTVSPQIVREAKKFGIEAIQSRDGKVGRHITITNYEQISRFTPHDFSACCCDEAGILKNFDGKTRNEIVEFMRQIPYRLLCTATAAPNDFDELGNHAECLGEMGYADMVTRFFRQQTSKDHLGWGRTRYALRHYAEHDFWRWVCSWARACRKPSDLGFDDGPFVLPDLVCEEHVIEAKSRRPGFLLDLPAITLSDQREERRRTIRERCERVAELVNGHDAAIAWCHLNPEGELLAKMIPESIEVSGKDSDESREAKIMGFIDGKHRVLISKPQLCGLGLNLQHCAHQTWFPSHSFEQYYQGVRRCLRFGQTKTVRVDLVTSEGEIGVMANLQRKSDQADMMFSRLVELMHDQFTINPNVQFNMQEETPAWLA